MSTWPGPELVPMEDVADYLHVHPRTIRRMIASGQLRGVLLERRTLVYADSLSEFIAARTPQESA